MQLLSHLQRMQTASVQPCVWTGDAFNQAGQGQKICFSKGEAFLSTDFDWDVEYTDSIQHLRQQQGVPTIGVLYDLITVQFPQFFGRDLGDRFKRLFMLTATAFDGLLAISRRTAEDFRIFCERHALPCPPIKVITLGDNLPAATDSPSPNVASLAEHPLILFVSTIERRKNHQVLYQAFHLLRRFRPELELPKLVFVGQKGWGVDELLKDIQLDPLTQKDIVLLHDCSDADLRRLYEKALFCVYPSFYEGWGLPVGEALAMGKAVLSSDQGSLPEVGGDLVRYISPWNATAWADAIAELITSPDKVRAMESKVRQNYHRREWSETASQVLDFIEELRLTKA